MALAFRVLFAAAALAVASGVVRAGETARGVVFNDRNANGLRDEGEPGIGGVLVSNGREVVETAPDGRYAVGVDDDAFVFVIKPRGFVTRVSERGLPRFFYAHKPAGSPPGLEHAGVAPTGALPASVDFPLVERAEPDAFRVILFGDPQPYTIEEVNAFAHDVVEEVIGAQREVGASFGVTLGDLVGDDLGLFEPYADVVSTVGVPWHNLSGNHDMNLDVDTDALADEAFERVFGPTNYAFVHGPVLFFIFDNVVYEGRKPDGRPGGYHATFSAEQLGFMQGALAGAEYEFVVVMMHIPLVEVTNSDAMIALLGETPSFSIGAHWHRHGTFFMEAGGAGEHGDEHGEPDHHVHVHVVQGTTSGSWWQGAPDEYGLPHAMMRDGKPNGWSILSFERDGVGELAYSMRYKAARRPWSDQLHLWAPDEVSVGAGDDAGIDVIANVYAGSERSVVEMRVRHVPTGEVGEWRPMEIYTGVDPYWTALKALEASDRPPHGARLTNSNPQTLLWRARLPAMETPGAAVIEVRTTDMFGQTFEARRVVRAVGIPTPPSRTPPD